MSSRLATTNRVHNFLLDWFIPQKTEIAIYIIALGFLVTPFLNPGFAALIDRITDNNEGGGFLVVLFACAIIASVLAGFLPVKVPGSIYFTGVVLAFSSLFLGLEYLYSSDAAWSIILGLYHAFGAVFIFGTTNTENRKVRQQVEARLSALPQTRPWKIVVASVIVIAVFVFFYAGSRDLPLWIVPISVSMIIWQIVELVVNRQSKKT